MAFRRSPVRSRSGPFINPGASPRTPYSLSRSARAASSRLRTSRRQADRRPRAAHIVAIWPCCAYRKRRVHVEAIDLYVPTSRFLRWAACITGTNGARRSAALIASRRRSTAALSHRSAGPVKVSRRGVCRDGMNRRPSQMLRLTAHKAM